MPRQVNELKIHQPLWDITDLWPVISLLVPVERSKLYWEVPCGLKGP